MKGPIFCRFRHPIRPRCRQCAPISATTSPRIPGCLWHNWLIRCRLAGGVQSPSRHRRQHHGGSDRSSDGGTLLSRSLPRMSRTVAFMFPGQGAQYVGMGAGLYNSEPEFARWIDRGAELLKMTLGVDLRGLYLPHRPCDAVHGRRAA